MDKKSQIKTLVIFSVLALLLSFIVYAVSSSLRSPIESFIDDDGYLDLRGSCVPTLYDGTTSFNITNATLYSDVSGTWLRNKTLDVITSEGNATYLFNFTNYINQSAEGTFNWNIECSEENVSNSFFNANDTSFANNRTIIVRYANTAIASIVPADNFFDLDGDDINVTAEISPTTGWNITNVSLYTNESGWASAFVYNLNSPFAADFFANFSITGLADGSQIEFSILAYQIKNISNDSVAVTSSFFSVNRTIFVEYPATVTLNTPANDSWTSNARDDFNFTVSSVFTDNTGYSCQLYTNETGSWLLRESLTASNDTVTGINYQPAEVSELVWGFRCEEQAQVDVFNFSINRTVHIDRTNPIVVINFVDNNTVVSEQFSNNEFPLINFTVTELNLDTCILYVNDTVNSTANADLDKANFTIDSAEGVFNFTIGCNDTANNFANSSVFNLVIDRTAPVLTSFSNFTKDNSADTRTFNFTSDEPVDTTYFFGLITDIQSPTIFTNSSFESSPNLTLTIDDFLPNTEYYWNITACDRAGNCLDTAAASGQFNFTYPFQVIEGWNYYGIYDAKINFSVILNQTSAEFVYFWNQTNQEFVFSTAGSTANLGFEVGISAGERAAGGRHVIALFEETNSTWVRNTTNSGVYVYNFTSGDNFIKLPTDFTFGNLSLTFLNTTFQDGIGEDDYNFGVEESTTPTNASQDVSDPEDVQVGGVKYNITDLFFSAFNLTARTWEPFYIYNLSIDNNTILTPLAAGVNNFEVVWIFSEQNITWNTTNIIGNWTY